MAYSDAYAKYVTAADDLVGIIAYGLYKQAKVKFVQSHHSTSGPTAQQLQSFHDNMCMDDTVDAYRTRALQVYNAIFQVKVAQMFQEREKAFNQDQIGQHLLSIKNKLDAKRTLGGWAADVVGNLLVNVVTIFVIGALLLGYKAIESGDGLLDRIFHVESHTPGAHSNPPGAEKGQVTPGGNDSRGNTGHAE